MAAVHEAGINAVGQSALLPHLLEQARSERAAAKYLVHNGSGIEIRRGSRHARKGQLQACLRPVVIDLQLLAELRRDIRHRCQFLPFRQAAENRIQLALQRFGVDCADDGDVKAATREHGAVRGAQIIGRDGRQAFLRAFVAPGIGVAAIESLCPFIAGDRIGIVPGGDDVGHDLRADAVDRRLVEARRGHRQPEQVECLVLMLRKHAHRPVDAVAGLAEAHFGAGVVEAGLEGVAVEVARAFIEQARHQVGEPFLAGRILRGAAVEHEADRHDRQRVVLDQPCGDARLGFHLLDSDGRAGRDRGQYQEQDGEDERNGGTGQTLRYGFAGHCQFPACVLGIR